MRLLLKLTLVAGLLLLAAAVPVKAYDGCRPEPVTPETPSGIAGCQLDGPTIGKASHWNGSTVAAQWCVFPWTDCGTVTIRSLETGRTVTAPVGMFCDCWWTTDRRLVDMPRWVVDALALSWSQGIYKVEVTPHGATALPDTAVAP